MVIGEYLPQTKNVFIDKANTEKASIHFAQENFTVKNHSFNHHQLNVVVSKNGDEIEENYTLDLTGIYQIKNMVTVLESCHQLKKQGWKIDENIIKKAVAATKKTTGLYGRWQCVQENPTVIFDVGHNVDGIKQIVQQLQETSYTNLHIIIGMVKDKDVDAVLQLLPQNATYYFTKAQIERALQQDELKLLATKYGLKGNTFNNVNIALKDAKNNAVTTDLILVCGSVFLVGEVDLGNG